MYSEMKFVLRVYPHPSTPLCLASVCGATQGLDLHVLLLQPKITRVGVPDTSPDTALPNLDGGCASYCLPVAMVSSFLKPEQSVGVLTGVPFVPFDLIFVDRHNRFRFCFCFLKKFMVRILGYNV